MNSKYAIETFSLTKFFNDWWGRAKVVAVEDLNLKINYNEVYGLLGPNGSGKTTTIKMLLSLLHPTKGKCLVLGGDARDTKINSRIGFLPEESYLYKYLTARETLDFYGRIFGLPGSVRKERIDVLLDMVGLSAVANRQIGTFSKGMARRIGLAQSLINDPDLLILDEPTSGLDPIGTRQIKDLIIKLSQRGKTILLCSHLLADVEDVCDRISILYGGKMRCEGKVSDLLVQSNKKQIIAEDISSGTIEKLQKVLQDENVKYQIDSPLERLEQFFIDTVATAQKEKHRTSGAVSKSAIGGFLAEQKSQVLIDKLVSGEQVSPEPVKAVSAEPQKASVDDSELLNKLTTQQQEVSTKPAEKITEQVKTKPASQIDVNLLDELTGNKSSTPKEQGND